MIRLKKMKVAFLNIAFLTCFVKLSYASSYDEGTGYTEAHLTVKYQRPEHKQEIVLNGIGKYARQSRKSVEHGYLYHAGPEETWCNITHHVKPESYPWIALIPRENDTCKYSVKIKEALRLKASAVIIYNNVNHETVVILDNVDSMTTVMIDLKTGVEYTKLVGLFNKHRVFCKITVGAHRNKKTEMVWYIIVIAVVVAIGTLIVPLWQLAVFQRFIRHVSRGYARFNNDIELLAVPEAPPISTEVTPHPPILGHTREAKDRYSTSSNVSDTDSALYNSTIALVSNPTTV